MELIVGKRRGRTEFLFEFNKVERKDFDKDMLHAVNKPGKYERHQEVKNVFFKYGIRVD